MIARKLAAIGLFFNPSAVLADLGKVTDTYRITGGYHEGIAYDRIHNRLLLTSLVSNSVISLDPDNNFELTTVYTPEDDNPIINSLGLKVDESSGGVHLATSEFGTFDKGGYALLDLPPTNEAVAAASVGLSLSMPCTGEDGVSGCGLANDVVVGDGVAYVADSMNGRVFKVENDEMVLISEDPLLKWDDANFPFGSNGLVYDGRGFLLVGNTQKASLVKIDLATNKVTEVDIIGEVGGGDGLLYSNGRLYKIGGTAIYILESDDSWDSATVLGSINIDESGSGETATTATFGANDDEIFVTFVRFGDLFGDGPNNDESLIARVALTTDSTPVTPDTAPLGVLAETFRVPAKYPEGIAYDPINQRLLLTSLTSNSIVSLDPDNEFALMTEFTPDTENPSSMGLKVDESGKVHVATTDFSTFDKGGYALYDLDESTGTATVESVMAMTCIDGDSNCGLSNDVVLGNTVYLADSTHGRVFEVKNDELVLVTEDPLLKWTDANFPFGSNGLVYDDRGFLIVSNTQQATLVRVDLKSGEVASIPFKGDIANVDGMLLDSKKRLFCVTGTMIYVLTDEANAWKSAVVRGTIDIDQSEFGESASTATFGETEDEIFVTYVRFGDLFGAGFNEDPSLIGRVKVGSIPCLTEEECNEQRKAAGITNFYVDDYPSKGCYTKGENAFFADGSEEDMSIILSGKKERLYCSVGVPTVPVTKEVDAINCMTKEECKSQATSMGFNKFYTGDYPSKGCYYKGSNAYFSEGSEADMITEYLPGKLARIYCNDDSSANIQTSKSLANNVIPESISYPNSPSGLEKGVDPGSFDDSAGSSYFVRNSWEATSVFVLTLAIAAEMF